MVGLEARDAWSREVGLVWLLRQPFVRNEMLIKEID